MVNNQYLDAKFEFLKYSLKETLDGAETRTAIGSPLPQEIEDGILHAKLHFEKVLERHASQYEGGYQDFVSLAKRAANLAEQSGSVQTDRLRTHAQEIEETASKTE